MYYYEARLDSRGIDAAFWAGTARVAELTSVLYQRLSSLIVNHDFQKGRGVPVRDKVFSDPSNQVTSFDNLLSTLISLHKKRKI